ncbi:MAG: MBL fold metallo-hydrolase [bacterium]|nr:MBL fold metallo-hydrolase [bacterium]
MDLEFIGIGSFFAKNNFHNNLLINQNILIDCGFMAGHGLHASGRNFGQIEHIFVTHTHADHIGGLEECAFFSKFVKGGAKPNIYVPSPLAEKLWAFSLRGGLEDIETGGASLSDYFNLIVVKNEFEIEGVHFEVVRTNHVANRFCCGLMIDKRVLFSGDTQFDPAMVERHGEDAEKIFHDCQFFTGGIHASLDELSTLPKSIRQKTKLMHLPDNHVDHIETVEQHGFGFVEQHTPYSFL